MGEDSVPLLSIRLGFGAALAGLQAPLILLPEGMAQFGLCIDTCIPSRTC